MEVIDTTGLSKEVLAVEQDSRDSKEGDNVICGVDNEGSEEKSVHSSEDHSEEQAAATPENKNDNNSNITSSSIRSVPSLEKSDSEHKEDSSCENACVDGSSKVQAVFFSQIWSETFNSPKDLLGFSPSETGSRHGLGKEVQTSWEKQIVASLYSLGSD